MIRKSLGRGLAALIPEAEPIQQNGEHGAAHEIELSLISPNPYQPRKFFEEEKLQDLVQSIREHGIIQPIVVSRYRNRYQIIVGERRWRAAQEAGLTHVPVIVKEISKRDQMELALVENLQREDLNPIEEAEGYNMLMLEFGLTQDELSKRIGKSRSAVANTLRLTGLPSRVKEFLISGELTAGHARALLPLEEETLIIRMAELIVKDGLSVRQTEEAVKPSFKGNGKAKKRQNGHVEYAALQDLEQRLRLSLGTRVNILAKEGEKGKIELHYFSQDDFARIITVLLYEESTRDNTFDISLM